MSSLVSRSVSLLMAGAIALGMVSFAVAEDSPTSIDIKIQRECAHILDLTERASCETRLRTRLSTQATQAALELELKQRCDPLTGDARVACIAEVRASHGVSQEVRPEPRMEQSDLLRGLDGIFRTEMQAAIRACELKPEGERKACLAAIKMKIEQEHALTRSLHVAPRNFRRELLVALRTEADAGEDVCRQKPIAERRQCMVDLNATMRLRVDAAIRALQGL